MTLTIASLLDVVDRVGWKGGRTDLLTYPEYVIFKGIDTLIDKKRIRLGLKLNVNAPLFNPQIFKDNKPPKSDIIDKKIKIPPSTNINI